jgi:hypothetical protein
MLHPHQVEARAGTTDCRQAVYLAYVITDSLYMDVGDIAASIYLLSEELSAPIETEEPTGNAPMTGEPVRDPF